jgi:O-antigen/teichoic acid export membrane protein
LPSQTNPLLRSIFTLGVAQVLSLIAGLLVTILLPRYLGDVNLGKLAFAGALTSLFGLIADLGTMAYLTKQVARDPAQAGSLTVSAILTRIPLGLGAALLTAGVVNLTGEDEVTKAIVYVLSAGMIVVSLANTFGAALQGLQRMRALAVSMVIGKLLYAALVAALLLSGFGVVEVAIASLLSSFIGATVGAVALGRIVTATREVTRDSLRRVVSGGIPFFVWQAALVVYGQIDFVLLSLMTTDAVVGWYAAAYRIIMIPAFVPTTVVTAVFPALSAAAHDLPAFRGLAHRSIRLLALTTVPMAFGILVLPDRLIELLNYPESFSHSVFPIVLLALHMPLAGIDTVLGTMLATLDRQRAWALTGVAAAFLNPALNMIAIPITQSAFGNGAIGAAAITTVTELFMLGVALRLMPRGVLGMETGTYVGKCFAAALLMAAVVWPLREAPLLISVIVGIVAYAAGAIGLKLISLSELREYANLVQRRGAPPAPLPVGDAAS